MTTLADNLSTLMKRFAISSSELARRTGIGQTVIHRLVNQQTSNPKIDTLRPIAKFFALSISQLIGDEDLNKPLIHAISIIPWQETTHWQSYVENTPSCEQVIADLPSSEGVFATLMNDHTMEPKFPIESTLLFDSQRGFEDQRFALVYKTAQQQVIFRQTLVDGEMQYLKPLNHDFKIQRFTEEDVCLGIMLQAKIKL